ncbi:M16 family metallopeptidase [Flavobacterium notoginsengisoli]|uniref:M16 family metallopeptidase n=1 Tax=Flavobacterium notoginsengisoli TaxID=1478199 RepID=UPI003635D0C9
MKKMLITLWCATGLYPIAGYSQQSSDQQLMPSDPSFRKGKLANGMVYYIKKTQVVKDAASYYIIQNVGSILENEDQRGLAHFLEHMAFNGTQNFPGKALLGTLEKNGAVFGKDINAYTSFDETVYNLSNIPNKNGMIDNCLTVLHDWSHYLLLTDQEIDSERGVIKEEWRTRQNGSMRMFEASLPLTYNNSKYVDRMPIGLMSVVEGFKYKALRDFYHDWYRTDLQAIAVIGDINVDEIEEKIKQKFSSIPAVENPLQRTVVHIPENDKLLFKTAVDLEITSASISFGIRHDKPSDRSSIGAFKKSLLQTMAVAMVSSRLADRAQMPDASFLSASVRYGDLCRTENQLDIDITPKPERQQDAFKEVMTEWIRARNFGFVTSEIERTVARFTSSYQNQIAKKNDKSHESISQEIKANYLDNETISPIEEEYKIAKGIFENLKPEELHQALKGLYSQKNRYIFVTGVSGQNNLTEQQTLSILTSVENDQKMTPYTENAAVKSLVDGITIKAGKINKTEETKQIGATTFVLNNGIKVHYKFVNKQKDNVTLNAVSYGGKTLIEAKDLPSADIVDNLAQLSGIGQFTAIDLKRILSGKNATVRTNISDYTESVSGSSSTKDLETMLQLVYLCFTAPRFDQQSFQVLQNKLQNSLQAKKNDVNNKISDSLTMALYGAGNPRKRLFNEAYTADMSFEKAKQIYASRFANAADFQFFITGDIETEALKPLLEKYIASIPTTNKKENFKAENIVEWKSEKTKKTVLIPMQSPKGYVNIAYKKQMPYSAKNNILTAALGDLLQLRVTETIRESEGGAYSPSAFARFMREPKPLSYIGFSFDCNPEMADKLVSILHQELQKMAQGNINSEDLSKVKTNFIKEREQLKGKNSYEAMVLTDYFRYNENDTDPKNFEDIVSALTVAEIQTLVQQILVSGKSYEYIAKPQTL